MGRDFAKKGRHKSHSHGANQSSHWIWLLAGMMIGIFISAIVFFKLLPQYPYFAQKAPENATAVAEKPTTAKPHFDFYSLLPELEVTIPEAKKPEQEKAQATQQPTPEADKGRYRLQLASFRAYKDADELKAQMAMLGVEVEIEAVTLAPNDTWYRVRSLPYANLKAAESARKQLQAQSIQSLLLEEKS